MAADFTPQLLAWFDQTKADLPWRTQPPDPYRVWLSEIMLQQTQIDTVIPYYHRFLDAFPDVHALAAAPLDAVLKLWEGLGYYSRARNLHKAAGVISQKFRGEFPSTAADLRALPGIGRYTAGAIASIAFDESASVLDGNVIRVFTRLLDMADDVTQTATKNRLWDVADDWVPSDRPGDYNQALMELGQTICTPRNPVCDRCPVADFCAARRNGTHLARPVKAKKKPTPHYDVAAGIVYDGDGHMLIAQRPHDGLLGGLWEFPGGKQEPGETLPEALVRELQEELAITVAVGELFTVVKHAFTHFKITLHAFECRLVDGQPQAIEAADFAWVTFEGLERYSFGKADRAVIAEMRRRREMLL